MRSALSNLLRRPLTRRIMTAAVAPIVVSPATSPRVKGAHWQNNSGTKFENPWPSFTPIVRRQTCLVSPMSPMIAVWIPALRSHLR